MSVTIRPGEPIPLSLTLPVDVSNKYVRAFVSDHLESPIAGSPFLLTYDARGRYKNYSQIASLGPKFLRAEYVVYDDPGFTVQSLEFSTAEDYISVDDSTISSDPRLAFLDAPISTRATPADIVASQQGTTLLDLVGTIDGNDELVGVVEEDN